MTSLADALPVVNACLNGLSATLAILGWRAIKRKNVGLHWKLMVAASASSALFLACYVTRFLMTGSHRFEGPPAMRFAYLVILFSHMALAVAVVPLVITVLTLAARGRIEKHRRLARVTLPIWIYVSVTGVVIYVMLYHLSDSVR